MSCGCAGGCRRGGPLLIPVRVTSGGQDQPSARIIFDAVKRSIYNASAPAVDLDGTDEWKASIESYGVPVAVREVIAPPPAATTLWSLDGTDTVSGTAPIPWRFFAGASPVLIAVAVQGQVFGDTPLRLRVPLRDNAIGIQPTTFIGTGTVVFEFHPFQGCDPHPPERLP